MPRIRRPRHGSAAEGFDPANRPLAHLRKPLGSLTTSPLSRRPGHRFSFWAWLDPVKGKPVAVEGDLSAEGMRFAIVVARWNAVITDRLLAGRARCPRIAAAPAATTSSSFACPAHGRFPAQPAPSPPAPLNAPDAIVTLGCLLRGETAHYEAIYNEVSRGIGQSQQDTGIPHSFGVLTCETLEQALDRAGIKSGNKGFEAALAAIEMVSLRRKLLEERRA